MKDWKCIKCGEINSQKTKVCHSCGTQSSEKYPVARSKLALFADLLFIVGAALIVSPFAVFFFSEYFGHYFGFFNRHVLLMICFLPFGGLVIHKVCHFCRTQSSEKYPVARSKLELFADLLFIIGAALIVSPFAAFFYSKYFGFFNAYTMILICFLPFGGVVILIAGAIISTLLLKVGQKKQENQAAIFIKFSVDAAKNAFTTLVNFVPLRVN